MVVPSFPRASIVCASIAALLLEGGLAMVSARERIAAVAVFPVENLSGGIAPVNDLRQFLTDRLATAGIRVLPDRDLEQFMARHRVRYVAGLDAPTAESLAKETGVDAVLIPSFELSIDAAPPKVAMMARLVSVKEAPTVVWADDAGLSGDDAPGWFGLGLVNDYQKLQATAMNRLAGSLLGFIKGGELKTDASGASKFKPKMWYRDPSFEPHAAYTVAVVPFVNLSDRRNAGEILAALFMRHLSRVEQFRVIDAGVVRAELLNARIIMDGGLSVTDAETIAALIDADLIVGGRVLRYDDYEGATGLTRVEFSTLVIERKTRRVVWSSDSYNAGSDGVGFFERGGSKTAHSMATQMVRLTTETLAGRDH